MRGWTCFHSYLCGRTLIIEKGKFYASSQPVDLSRTPDLIFVFLGKQMGEFLLGVPVPTFLVLVKVPSKHNR